LSDDNKFESQEQKLLNCQFEYANWQNPSNFNYALKNSTNSQERALMDFDKGTTTLAFRTAHGCCIAVDSRSSMGEFNSSEDVRKVVEMNDYLLATMAGTAADCQYFEPLVAIECRKYELMYGERMSVVAAAKQLSNISYQYRGYGLGMGCMFAGVDKKGVQLFYLDNEGNNIQAKMFSVGSGSPYAYGILDTKHRWDMTKDEAVELAVLAISEATYIDSASGGVCRVYWIPEGNIGWELVHDALDNSVLNWNRMKKNGTVGTERFMENCW